MADSTSRSETLIETSIFVKISFLLGTFREQRFTDETLCQFDFESTHRQCLVYNNFKNERTSIISSLINLYESYYTVS